MVLTSGLQGVTILISCRQSVPCIRHEADAPDPMGEASGGETVGSLGGVLEVHSDGRMTFVDPFSFLPLPGLAWACPVSAFPTSKVTVTIPEARPGFIGPHLLLSNFVAYKNVGHTRIDCIRSALTTLDTGRQREMGTRDRIGPRRTDCK